MDNGIHKKKHDDFVFLLVLNVPYYDGTVFKLPSWFDLLGLALSLVFGVFIIKL